MKILGMIKYMLTVAAFLPLSLMAQTDPTGKVSYSEIVEVKGATTATLMDRANTFLTLKKIENKKVGTTITGVGALNVAYTSIKKGPENGLVKFNLKLMIKDGKYKMDMTDFKHEGIMGKSTGGPIELEKPECGEAQLSPASWAAIKEQTQTQLKAFVQELKIKMDNPAKKVAPSSDF
jgi:hypothetical protein